MKFGRARASAMLEAVRQEARVDAAFRLQGDQGELVHALTSVDSRSDLAVSRTRRRVYSTVIDMQEQRKGRSKQGRTVVVALAVLITLLAPAVWTSALNFSAGAHFADMQTQISLLPLMLFPGIVAVATASYMRHRQNRQL